MLKIDPIPGTPYTPNDLVNFVVQEGNFHYVQKAESGPGSLHRPGFFQGMDYRVTDQEQLQAAFPLLFMGGFFELIKEQAVQFVAHPLELLESPRGVNINQTTVNGTDLRLEKSRMEDYGGPRQTGIL